jgi:tetratricopeptide (TPR) repeat protein
MRRKVKMLPRSKVRSGKYTPNLSVKPSSKTIVWIIKLDLDFHKSDPHFMNAEVNMLLGDRLFSNQFKDYKGALEHYKRASMLIPSSSKVYTKLGQVYEKTREFDHAIEYYKKAIRRDSKAFVPLMRLGLVLIRNN